MVVREAVGDRSSSAHSQSLFDMDAKYADIVTLDDAIRYFSRTGNASRNCSNSFSNADTLTQISSILRQDPCLNQEAAAALYDMIKVSYERMRLKEK
jgi:hypothetical protein